MSHFVVLDTETTGFNFSKTDRVVEVGAIKYNRLFEEVDRFETLINPMRDMGPQHVHGIEASWVLDAPKFDEIADSLLSFLDGALIVGHNIEFDLNFLISEFSRNGREASNLKEHSLDTLKIARSIYGANQSCKLSDLAILFDIDFNQGHAAIADAEFTAKVLQILVSSDLATSALLGESLEDLYRSPSQEQHAMPVLVQRPKLSETVNSSFITSLVEALPVSRGTSLNKLLYSDYLKRAIADGLISDSEAKDLMEIAKDIGMSIADVSELHLEVFSGITKTAWSDGHLSDFEKALIDQIAKQLGVGEIELELAKSGKGYVSESAGKILNKGDLVVLTGSMQPPKEVVATQILAFGAEVSDSLTKKTNLLVAADPNTLSGKGQKARNWGIPIVSTTQLLSELDS